MTNLLRARSLVETGDTDFVCLQGRGTAPPEHCGGPRGYQLMLRRQAGGAEVSDADSIAASIQLLSETYPDGDTTQVRLLEECVLLLGAPKGHAGASQAVHHDHKRQLSEVRFVALQEKRAYPQWQAKPLL